MTCRRVRIACLVSNQETSIHILHKHLEQLLPCLQILKHYNIRVSPLTL